MGVIKTEKIGKRDGGLVLPGCYFKGGARSGLKVRKISPRHFFRLMLKIISGENFTARLNNKDAINIRSK